MKLGTWAVSRTGGQAMIIAVASGKGGTGKTTVAVNLALALAADTRENTDSADLLFLDCDVCRGRGG